MTLFSSILVLGVIGITAAVLLYIAAKKFHVEEDPKIAEVEELLPGANCGGCGLSGCHAFAVACAGAKSMDGLNCVSLNEEGMKAIADVMGFSATARQKMVAVARCNSSCETRTAPNRYNGVSSCAIEAALYQGESECTFSCLGKGDCAVACPFDALVMDELDAPLVDWEKCVGCGRCVEACPRGIMQLLPLHSDRPLVWVACSNTHKGPIAMKECDTACIGCGKCIKSCPEKAPSVTSFLASIDAEKCTGCGSCIEACPRKSIVASYNNSNGSSEPINNTTKA